MQDLQLVGVHDDGEHVLLVSADGHRFRLPIDEPLRAAVRRDRARLGQLQIAIEGALRPRDIQARIRAGETAEDVALASGLPIEHIRKYEGPVLAEREHVAETAQHQPVRAAGASRGPQLAELVSQRRTARGVQGGSWDAWRRDDGSWTVQLSFRAGSKDRQARWTYDLTRRTLDPVDDESRWLTAAEAGDEGPIPGRRLAAVKERVYDVEADGGVREAHRTGGRRGAPVPGALEPASPARKTPKPAGQTVDLLEELRGRRGRRQPALTPEEMAAQDEAAQDDDALLDEPPAAHPAASQPHEATDAEILALPEVAGATEGSAEAETEAEAEPDTDDVDDDPSADTTTPHHARSRHDAGKSSKSKRASVPSWDEIVFGGKKD